MDAILEALEREPLELLHKALLRPKVFQRLVRAKYLPRPESHNQLLYPDSHEAFDAAILYNKRKEAAARTWVRLSEQERQTVQEVTDRICGDGRGEELAYDLDIRVQPG